MEMTIGQTLLTNAFNFGDREAIVIGDIRATFAELNDAVNRRANALLELGVKKGHHVGTLFGNSMELIESIYALARIGAVVVPLNTRFSSAELIYVMDHSDVSTVIFQDQFEETIQKIRPAVSDVKQLICSGETVPDEFIDFEAKTRKQSVQMPQTDVKESDIATIMYTSGTTGKPKGVVATHKIWVWGMVNAILAKKDIFQKPLTVFPLFHLGAFMQLFACHFSGNSMVMLKGFDPKLVLETIEKERITEIFHPPTVYRMLLQIPDLETYDLSSIRNLNSGSEALPDEIRQQLKKVFPQARIIENYGQTESVGGLTSLQAEDADAKRFSVGRPFPNTRIGVVNEEGNDATPGTVGEIIGCGPSIMKEYYKNPEKTADTIRDGWLYTGDMGRLDADGFLYIKERKNHMIISGGENIYPKEVEEVLYQHSKIIEAAVFGLPDEIYGQKVCAAVVVKPGEQMAPEEVIDFCKDNLASFKKPKEVYFMEDLPKSPIGKVLRSALKKQYQNT
ncbi:MAG: long-chain-fatty-acid--CoA ligase [Deltaproteobacteria bacterium]|jgi:fatty-acyl-CoA synthase|nr:long-chain-fatty-acid--CoA ligase [Deltaproteobacteria bacterium]MBT4643811.1 long-chain-fatty-acid--CoA ligase [Deltaproteobacteria bacterium]